MNLNPLICNLLSDILEIRREIGVYPIGLSRVPFSWSFGTCLGPSSEGFLATFTPGEGSVRIQVFNLDFLSEDSAYTSHSSFGCTFIKLLAAAGVSEPSSILSSQRRGVEEPVPGHDRRQPMLKDDPRVMISFAGTPGEVLIRDLMNPTSTPGILVTLKPTDEVPSVRTEIPRLAQKKSLGAIPNFDPIPGVF
jgi:hypothetical protein